jgi:hypothetical protein
MSRSPNFSIKINDALREVYRQAAKRDGYKSLGGWLKSLADQRIHHHRVLANTAERSYYGNGDDLPH